MGEPTLGDHLREVDARAVLVGKTHITADVEGMAWLRIDPDSARQNWSAYDDYLVALGSESENLWEDFANSGSDANGARLSAWMLKNSRLAANVPEEHSETAYMTNCAMEFMTEAAQDDRLWSKTRGPMIGGAGVSLARFICVNWAQQPTKQDCRHLLGMLSSGSSLLLRLVQEDPQHIERVSGLLVTTVP